MKHLTHFADMVFKALEFRLVENSLKAAFGPDRSGGSVSLKIGSDVRVVLY